MYYEEIHKQQTNVTIYLFFPNDIWKSTVIVKLLNLILNLQISDVFDTIIMSLPY